MLPKKFIFKEKCSVVWYIEITNVYFTRKYMQGMGIYINQKVE